MKLQVLEEGRVFVRALADEGNTDEGLDQAFDVLGDLGPLAGAAGEASG